jgi:hypothetical protein
LSNDVDLISHVEALALANNDQEKFMEVKKIADNKRNGKIEYMEYLLTFVIIG